ncbi:MAG: hypothetical protein Q4B68_06735, partial [Bacteroidales bacterium]|nr:hypothetical protein [Bacteroidales bacterium]
MRLSIIVEFDGLGLMFLIISGKGNKNIFQNALFYIFFCFKTRYFTCFDHSKTRYFTTFRFSKTVILHNIPVKKRVILQ